MVLQNVTSSSRQGRMTTTIIIARKPKKPTNNSCSHSLCPAFSLNSPTFSLPGPCDIPRPPRQSSVDSFQVRRPERAITGEFKPRRRGVDRMFEVPIPSQARKSYKRSRCLAALDPSDARLAWLSRRRHGDDGVDRSSIANQRERASGLLLICS